MQSRLILSTFGNDSGNTSGVYMRERGAINELRLEESRASEIKHLNLLAGNVKREIRFDTRKCIMSEIITCTRRSHDPTNACP